MRRACNLSPGRQIRIARTIIASAFLWLGLTVASAYTSYTANQLVFVNVDHAPVGALSTLAYGYKGANCGLGMSSSAIPYSGGGGGVIVALSGNAGLQALPFVASTASIGSSATFFADANVQRTLTPCTDQWNVPSAGLAFTHFTPAWSMPEINTASLTDKKRFFLPATWMTFTVTNNTGAAEDFYFGLPAAATPTSFANGAYQGFALGEAALAVQSGSCDLLSGSSLTAALNGVSTGFAFHLGVPAGQTKSLTVVVAYYRSTVVDTRINAAYYYTKLFSSMDNVIDSAFAEFADAQARCQQLANAMQNAGLNPYRQFLASDALHSYQCNTVYLVDPTNGVYWREVEGAYGNINTCDLMVDHAFYSVEMHPWALRNVLDTFSGAANAGVGYTFTHALYNETTGAQVSANGFSFQHEMGGNNSNGQVSNDPNTDPTEYETVFSYMGQEELDDWVACAGLYWTHSGDNVWLTNNAALLRSCLNSERLRDDTNSAARDGVTTYLNYSTQSGKYEITTYDSLDPSLQDPRAGAYTAVKNWAAYLALQAMFNQLGDSTNATIASNQAALCSSSVTNGWNATLGYIPASLAGNNTSATLPILEGLALVQWMGFTNATDRQAGPYASMLQTLRNHALAVLMPGRCLDATSGGLKITSANDNTFPSKEFIAQYAAETVLGLTGNTVDGTVDQVNATLQMLQAPYQGLSDQINSPGGTTPANSSLHYPRGITSALWWLTPTNNPAYPVPASAPATPTSLTAIAGNGQAVLIWNASAQAAGYNVKRGNSSGGPYYPVATAVTGASYTDTSVTNGATYYYVITATNQIGESLPSAEASLTLVPVLDQITIQNYSFEAQTVAANTYAIENPTSWSVSGQSGGAIVAIIHPGTSDNRFGAGNFPAGMDGSNYCQLYMNGTNGSATVYQDTGVKYRSGANYNLTAALGLEKGGFPTGALVLYNSSLVAIASNVITSAMLTSNAFTSFSVNYTGTGNEGGNGDIVVGFNTTGAAAGTSFDIDNVRMASPPLITSQPVSKTNATGSTVSFSVGASGTAPLSCLWQAGPPGGPYTNLVNGGQISGANTNILTITGVTANWALAYQVIVTNSYGAVTSSPAANLTVTIPVTNSISIANYSFENPVVADGSYTTSTPGWSASGNAGAFAIINPGTNNWLSATPPGMDGVNAGQIFMTAPGQSGILYQDTGIKYVAGVTYQLTAAIGLETNQVFDTNSAVVFYNSALTAIASNVITPANLVAGAFTNLTLTYTATGNEGGNGDIVVGFYAPPAAAGSSYFDFDNVQLSAIYPTYPVITSQPVSQSTYQGQTISFSVTAVGSGTLGYQWQATNSASGGFTNLVNGGVISGATSNVLTFAGVTTNWSLAYQVIVTNASGSVTSTVANLTVVWTNIYVAPGGNVQVAINQAYTNGGGQVNLAPGTYYGNIVMYPGVTLNGSGSNTIIAASTISGPQNNPASGYTVQNLVVNGQISCSYFSIGATNVPGLASVSGLTGLPGINGGNPSGSPASYNLTYRNVEVKNTSIGMQCWSVYGLVITNCNFHDDGIGFSHNIYLVGCPGFKFVNCISAWSRTGDGLHLDFASDGGFTNSFIQSEFDGEWSLGILDQAWNGSANYTKLKGCGIKYGGQGGLDGSGIDIDYTGDLQTSRFEYNHGNGATIRGSTALLYDSFNGNTSAPYFSYAAASNNLVGGTGANIYHATLANGVTGPNNTADWVTTYGGQTEGAVDFNANHSLNGSLTWPNVSSTSAGTRQFSLVYANGTSTNVTMQMIVNGGVTNTLTFPPTGGWSTYSAVSSNVTLTAANNTVQMLISNPGATCPILSALVVNDSVPAVPSAPTGLTYLALTNAPKYDMSCWIHLSWNAATGATYYNIQRNGVWLAIGVPTNGFTDYHVPFTGSAFTYTIVPVNAGGSGSGTSITAYSLTGFPVTLTTATNGPGSVTLTCAWSTNAPTYNVYRAPVSGGPYAFIGSTGLTTNLASTPPTFFGIYTDTNAPGGTNYYVMTAYNGITKSLYSPEASAVVTGVAPVVSTNATLTSLVVNPALSFTPTFTASTLSYTATVAYGSTPTVTVAAANASATNQLIYNGATNVLAAGVASAPLTLNPNPAVTNVIQVQVTAQDGVTRQTYTVNVVQLPSQTKPVLTSGVSNGTLTLGWPQDHLGYRLLTQTNNLSLGVSANPNDWATVPGSTATNLINLPITTTNFDQYYRLVYP